MAPDREEAARLYREYGPAVYRRCLRLLGNRDAAQDATQEVFVKLVRELKSIREREHQLLPWLYRVATNHCLNLRRNTRRRGEMLDPDLDIRAEAPIASFPARRLAQQVLSRFDPGTQAVAVGAFVDGMEREEIAAALGISQRTVTRKLGRFLANAREFLGRNDT